MRITACMVTNETYGLKHLVNHFVDLVLIAPNATPPVCRAIDYGKFCFERDKREKEAKKKQVIVKVKEIELSCRINALIAIPASFGITLFSHPILSLLFGNQREAVETAAPLLSILGISVFLSCMITATNSVLHAYQEVRKPIYSTLAGLLAKGVTAYLLIGIPSIGLLGAPISSFFCNAVIVVMNMHFVSKFCDAVDVRSLLLYPTLLSILSVGIAYGEHLLLCYHFGQNLLTTLIPMATAALLYLVLGCLFGLISEEDLSALPMGKKICAVLSKIHLLSKKEFEKT